MRKMLPLLTFCLCLCLSTLPSYAGSKCLDAEGEAVINGDDLASAKTEAIARAKWSAVEVALGVRVKAQSVVQNMTLVDEAVSSTVQGYVSSYKVLEVKPENDLLWVKINACVDPVKAQQALSSLTLNNSIGVFIPARKPRVALQEEEIRRTSRGKSERHRLQTNDVQEETNVVSETLVGMLAEQGVTVVDVAPTEAADAAEVEKAMRDGNYTYLRTLMYKSLSNLLLIGKIDHTISTAKGQDIGYGLSMPFNHVTVRLTYRLVTKDGSGRLIILAAGTEQGRGVAGNVEDATAEALQEVADVFAPVVLEKVSRHLQGIDRKVTVKVDGVTELSQSFEMKELLQNLAWVSDVEPVAVGEFLVRYPENPIYLANSISQKGIRVKKFSPRSLTLEYSEK